MGNKANNRWSGKDHELTAIAGLLMGYRLSEQIELGGPHFADTACGLAWEATQYAWHEAGVGATEVVTTICGAPGMDPGTIEVFNVLTEAERRKPTEQQFHRACAQVKEQAFYDTLQEADRMNAGAPGARRAVINSSRTGRTGSGSRFRRPASS